MYQSLILLNFEFSKIAIKIKYFVCNGDE